MDTGTQIGTLHNCGERKITRTHKASKLVWDELQWQKTTSESTPFRKILESNDTLAQCSLSVLFLSNRFDT